MGQGNFKPRNHFTNCQSECRASGWKLKTQNVMFQKAAYFFWDFTKCSVHLKIYVYFTFRLRKWFDDLYSLRYKKKTQKENKNDSWSCHTDVTTINVLLYFLSSFIYCLFYKFSIIFYVLLCISASPFTLSMSFSSVLKC